MYSVPSAINGCLFHSNSETVRSPRTGNCGRGREVQRSGGGAVSVTMQGVIDNSPLRVGERIRIGNRGNCASRFTPHKTCPPQYIRCACFGYLSLRKTSRSRYLSFRTSAHLRFEQRLCGHFIGFGDTDKAKVQPTPGWQASCWQGNAM